MNERYCPSKKPYYEGDNQCYYHGYELVCPYCGAATKPCKEGKYVSPKGDYGPYNLRELGG